MCKHIFINENGFKVCCNCGETERIHYWNSDQIDEVRNRDNFLTNNRKIYKNHKWNRLSKLNKIFVVNKNHFLYKEVLCILNLLPLSSEVKKNLHNYIIRKKLTSYKEVCKTFYKLIYTLDLPLTSTEFIEILHIVGRKHKYKPLTKLQNIESVRKYYWYITKMVEKAKKMLNFSPEDAQTIFLIVFNYYNLIRFKMLKSPNPIYLIQNLVYYTIREKYHPVQTKFNKRNFEIMNLSFLTYLIRYLKEIKKSNLDSCFPEKLVISKRNK